MTPKYAPYENIGRVAVALIVVLYIVHKVSPTFYPESIVWVMAPIILVIMACIGLELYVRIRQYREGNLFLIRNATFYTGLLIVVLVLSRVWQVAYGGLSSEASLSNGGLITSLFYIGFGLGFTTLTFSFVYLDSVMIEHRNGALRSAIPVFSVASASVQEDEILISSQEGRNILLRRPQFSSAAWSELRTRVSALAN